MIPDPEITPEPGALAVPAEIDDLLDDTPAEIRVDAGVDAGHGAAGGAADRGHAHDVAGELRGPEHDRDHRPLFRLRDLEVGLGAFRAPDQETAENEERELDHEQEEEAHFDEPPGPIVERDELVALEAVGVVEERGAGGVAAVAAARDTHQIAHDPPPGPGLPHEDAGGRLVQDEGAPIGPGEIDRE